MTRDENEGSRRTDEMRRYALACLALVLGRLGPRQLHSVLEDAEQELLKLLFNQVSELISDPLQNRCITFFLRWRTSFSNRCRDDVLEDEESDYSIHQASARTKLVGDFSSNLSGS